MNDGVIADCGGAVDGSGGSGGVGVRLLWMGEGSATGDWMRLGSKSAEDVSGVVDPRKSKFDRACCIGQHKQKVITFISRYDFKENIS